KTPIVLAIGVFSSPPRLPTYQSLRFASAMMIIIKPARVQKNAESDACGQTCVFLEKHTCSPQRHACFRKNEHGSGKDMRISEKPCMVPGETCVFLEKQAWFWKRHACFWRNTHVFWKSSMFPEEQECIRLTAGIPHAKK